MFKKATLQLLVLISLVVFITPSQKTFAKDIDPALQEEITALKKQAQANPDDTGTLLKLAERYGWAEMGDETIETYEKVLEVDPNNLKALNALKDFYSWSGRGDESIEMMKKIAELDPTDIQIKEDMAFNYMWNSQPEEAVRLFKEVVEADPSRAKARKTLGDLYSWTGRPEESIQEYMKVMNQITVPKEKSTLYNSVADHYYYSQSYKKAEEYYKRALEIDPDNEEARKDYERLKERTRPQVFSRYDSYKTKGGEFRTIWAGGLIAWFEDYRMKAEYQNNRRTELGERRLQFNQYGFEVNKQYGNAVNLTAGGAIKNYRHIDNNVRFEYFLNATKNFGERFTSSLFFSKREEDSSPSNFRQRVSRYSWTSYNYYRLAKRLDLSGSVTTNYYTAGHAPKDNVGFLFAFTPIFHLFYKPVLDFSYTYFRGYWVRKDPNATEVYEYWHPRKTETHAFATFFRYDITKRLTALANGTLAYTTDLEGDVRLTGNAEARYKITKQDNVSVAFTYSKQVHHPAELSDYKDQLVTVKFSHSF